MRHHRVALVGAILIAAMLSASCAASRPADSDPVVGTWQGHAVFREAPLAFGVRFYRDGDSLRANLSSPDLLVLDQPLVGVRYSPPHVFFATQDEDPIRFQGTLTGDRISGGAGVPAVPGVVEAHRDGDAAQLRFELRRASPPAAPPYASREVRFGDAGVSLAGTLLMPPVPAGHRLPGIVILQGSSSNRRQEYRFYADRFARAGLAVLAFDKRGSGESSGDYGAASYDDLAADAAAAVAWLRAQTGIDPDRVGVWGVSQGAFIAPLVARRVPLAFVAAVSPPGVTIGESAAYQDSMRLIGKGFSPADAAHAALLNRQILVWLRTGETGGLDATLTRVADLPWRRASSLPARLPAGAALNGWYWRGRTLDPVPLWRSLRTPVLVVFGAADELLPAAVSAERIREALRTGGNRDATVRVFPGANHVLRQLPLVTGGGGAWDWPRAAPGYLDTLMTWIHAHTR